MTGSTDAPPWLSDIPPIGKSHLFDARLYADRLHMIECIGPEKADAVVELGVALGHFSRALIDRYRPTTFYAMDLFDLHSYERLWDRRTADVFQGKSHLDFYLESMSAYRAQMTICQGDGAEQLARLEDKSVDVIYIDGSHAYPDVVRDSQAAVAKVKTGGIVIFNDYILWSHWEQNWYGVVPVVNDLVVNKGGKVIGLALHKDMYADIAIQI